MRLDMKRPERLWRMKRKKEKKKKSEEFIYQKRNIEEEEFICPLSLFFFS